jgi:hypothetical protein
VFCLDAETGRDGQEGFRGLDYVEYGDVGSCFCEAFCEGETAASSSSCYEGSAAFERELWELLGGLLEGGYWDSLGPF